MKIVTKWQTDSLNKKIYTTRQEISLKSSSMQSDIKTGKKREKEIEKDCLNDWNHNQMSKFDWLIKSDRLTDWQSLTDWLTDCLNKSTTK